MSHVPHELAEEFPADVELLQRLRAEDAHIARLCDDYHRINREIHRAETNVEPTSDAHMTELRKTRMRLKDEIAGALRAAAI
ncbi:MAG: YdcH family protein [Pseudomonadota bacterium]